MKYYIGNGYKRTYRTLNEARAAAMRMKDSFRSSVQVLNDKNEHVGTVVFGYCNEWRTTYRVFSKYLNEYRRLDKRWELHENGTLGKRLN